MKFKALMLVSAVVLLSGCICGLPGLDELRSGGSDDDSDTYSSGDFCPENYIQVGTDCCLDMNSNSICDRDEEQEKPQTTVKKTTLKQTTSTIVETTILKTTTLVETTTTTAAQIRCRTNSDCGQRREERVCKDGDVYVMTISPRCRKPGTTESNCIESSKFKGQTMMSQPSPEDKCADGCQDGVCI